MKDILNPRYADMRVKLTQIVHDMFREDSKRILEVQNAMLEKAGLQPEEDQEKRIESNALQTAIMILISEFINRQGPEKSALMVMTLQLAVKLAKGLSGSDPVDPVDPDLASMPVKGPVH